MVILKITVHVPYQVHVVHVPGRTLFSPLIYYSWTFLDTVTKKQLIRLAPLYFTAEPRSASPKYQAAQQVVTIFEQIAASSTIDSAVLLVIRSPAFMYVRGTNCNSERVYALPGL